MCVCVHDCGCECVCGTPALMVDREMMELLNSLKDRFSSHALRGQGWKHAYFLHLFLVRAPETKPASVMTQFS